MQLPVSRECKQRAGKVKIRISRLSGRDTATLLGMQGPNWEGQNWAGVEMRGGCEQQQKGLLQYVDSGRKIAFCHWGVMATGRAPWWLQLGNVRPVFTKGQLETCRSQPHLSPQESYASNRSWKLFTGIQRKEKWFGIGSLNFWRTHCGWATWLPSVVT